MSYNMVRLTDEDRAVQKRQAEALERIADAMEHFVEKGLFVEARQI